MSKTKGVGDEIPFKLDEIKIFKETPREEMCRLFKKHKVLVHAQLKQLSVFPANTVGSELRRMLDYGLLSAKQETVQLGENTTVRQMKVYRWLNKKAAEKSRRSYDR